MCHMVRFLPYYFFGPSYGKNLTISIDSYTLQLRSVYMSFEFNCRTNDNVELIMGGSFFWEIGDLRAMVKFTSDTTGDIW